MFLLHTMRLTAPPGVRGCPPPPLDPPPLSQEDGTTVVNRPGTYKEAWDHRIKVPPPGASPPPQPPREVEGGDYLL